MKIVDEFKVPILAEDSSAFIYIASYGIERVCTQKNLDENKSVIILWNLNSKDLSRLNVGSSNIFVRIIRNDN
jgi:hypothetical protein